MTFVFTLRQLEIFRGVIRTRTTVGAARALRVSQPAVSNAIRQMEARIGFPLFERVGSRLIPTPDAEEIYHDSEAIFSLYNAFTHRIEAHRRSEIGSLRIVSTPPIANALIPNALKSFSAPRPDLRVHLDTRRMDGVMEAVEMRMADLGFALNPPEREGLEISTIAKAQMVCAFAPGHRFEELATVSASDLEGERLILFEPNSRLDVLTRGFLGDGIRQGAVAQVRYTSIACLMAEADLGVTLVDSLTGVNGHRYGINVRPLSPALPVPVALITRRNEPAKRVHTAFLGALRAMEALRDLNSAPAFDE
ncbi:LysR family transcriptional regulator [Palleronia aestuarii]|uniref:LysR family transcriptional regulator n=1 Tax=Palleronia aestuarii TaxID=568105 RepID=UPI001474AD77|nr:LysR family transcriptional regulator [Palleronia aestuarii]